jgi:hypothetical protein
LILNHFLKHCNRYIHVPVTRKELRRYFEPALRRKTFRFSRLRGLVHEQTMQELRVAKAFAQPGKDAGAFMRQLCKAGPQLREPVLGILRELEEKPAPGLRQPGARAEAMDRIHRVLIECGVHAEFRMASSPGLMLHTRQAARLPVYLYLGESAGNGIGPGRFNAASDGSAHVDIDISQNAARLMQVIDYWLADFSNPPGHIDRFRMRLSRAPREQLLSALSGDFKKASLSEGEIPILLALDISCLRLLYERLQAAADESQSPPDFLRKALNMHIDWTLAHEIAHAAEHRANGQIRLHPMVREAIAYLLQAIHAEPAHAFRSMMLRGFDITEVMPSFDSALRSLGPHCFCVEGAYLRGWARGMLDAMLKGCGGSAGLNIEQEPIARAQTSDFISPKDLPYLEKALCNPNRRLDSAHLRLDAAESS